MCESEDFKIVCTFFISFVSNPSFLLNLLINLRVTFDGVRSNISSVQIRFVFFTLERQHHVNGPFTESAARTPRILARRLHHACFFVTGMLGEHLASVLHACDN